MRRQTWAGLTLSLYATLSPLHHIEASSTGPSNGNGFISPVRHLQESLAASAAHGTVIAISAGSHSPVKTKEENSRACMLILSQSPHATSLTSNLTASSFHQTQTNNHQQHSPPPGPLSSSLYLLHASAPLLLLAATGLAADVRHLVQCCAREVSHRRYLHHHNNNNNNAQLTPKRLVSAFLARRMTAAARNEEGGRPYGVQFLLIGQGTGKEWQIYAVDASGTWRHWGGGATAIGRHAGLARQKLAKWLQHKDEENGPNEQDSTTSLEQQDGMANNRRPKNAREALEVALRVAMETRLTARYGENLSSAAFGLPPLVSSKDALLQQWKQEVGPWEQFQAVVLYSSNGKKEEPCFCEVVHRNDMEQVYKKCLEELVNAHGSAVGKGQVSL